MCGISNDGSIASCLGYQGDLLFTNTIPLYSGVTLRPGKGGW